MEKEGIAGQKIGLKLRVKRMVQRNQFESEILKPDLVPSSLNLREGKTLATAENVKPRN